MEKQSDYEIVSLTFFKEWHELAKKYGLTMEQYGAVVYAMCEYGFYDKDSNNLKPPEGIIFDMAKPYIKSSNNKKIAGHHGGKNGGAPPGNLNAKKTETQKKKAQNETGTVCRKGNCVSLFLNMWENWAGFSTPYKIKDVEYWNQFWEENKHKKTYSHKDIYVSMRNLSHAVKNGHYEKRYISRDPCQFIKGGMLDRGLSEEFDAYWAHYGGWDDSENLKKVKADVYD